MFVLKIDTNNASFHDEDREEPFDSQRMMAELTRILDDIPFKLLRNQREGKCLDFNGNVVGEWRIE